MAQYLLGIDMGTGSSKGVLVTPDGDIVATATRSHSMSMPRPGWAEMDAERDWWSEVGEISNELLGQADGEILGVSISGLGPCVVLCDDELTPLRPAILYGIDMRATAEIEELTDELGDEEILRRCGKALSTQAAGPKVRWIQKNEPDVAAAATRIFSAHSYVVAKLTGEYTLDHHTASQYDPYYDITTQQWAQDWADEVRLGIELPRLCWSAEVVGHVHEDGAAATGIPVGTPVVAGTVDAWAEAFSAGVRNTGDLMLMYGSTMFFVQILESSVHYRGLWSTSGIDEGSHTLAAGMATSGSLTSWIQQLCGGAPFADLVAEASAVPAGSDGLLMLPYFAGERTPIFDPDARGVIAGLSLRHNRAHLFRAAYEGIAFGIRQILEFFEGSVGAPSRICAVGGGTQGGLWTQIVSDVCNRTQLIPAKTIGASYGGALMAAIGTGVVPPETDWSEVSIEVTPNPANRELYDRMFEDYCSLYPATKDQVHRLARMQEGSVVDA